MRIGKIFGISIELHPTFIWLFGLIAIILAIMEPAKFIPTLVLFAILFVTVFVHELFHSAVAISKGIKVSKIILMPIGGVSVADEMPEKPDDEFQIAIAGPLFNFAMVILTVLMVQFGNAPWPHFLFSSEITAESFNAAITNYPLFAFFWVNFLLGAFNLFVPALPLDGGRVFRALLAKKMGFAKATRIAAGVSSVLAIGLFVIGFLIQDLIMMIIAGFIYLGSAQEKEFAQLKELAKEIDFRKALNRKPKIIKGKLTLDEVAEEMKKRKEVAFLVSCKDGYGLITIDEIAKARGKSTTAEEAAPKAEVLPIEHKDGIINAIFAKRLPLIGISEKGILIGTISEMEINKMYALSKLDKKD